MAIIRLFGGALHAGLSVRISGGDKISSDCITEWVVYISLFAQFAREELGGKKLKKKKKKKLQRTKCE